MSDTYAVPSAVDIETLATNTGLDHTAIGENVHMHVYAATTFALFCEFVPYPSSPKFILSKCQARTLSPLVPFSSR